MEPILWKLLVIYFCLFLFNYFYFYFYFCLFLLNYFYFYFNLIVLFFVFICFYLIYFYFYLFIYFYLFNYFIFYFKNLDKILQLGADPRILNDDSQNSLFYLVSSKKTSPVGLFGHNQVDIENYVIGDNENALISTIHLLADHVEKNYGTSSLLSFINQQDKNGVTPLHIARFLSKT